MLELNDMLFFIGIAIWMVAMNKVLHSKNDASASIVASFVGIAFVVFSMGQV